MMYGLRPLLLTQSRFAMSTECEAGSVNLPRSINIE